MSKMHPERTGGRCIKSAQNLYFIRYCSTHDALSLTIKDESKSSRRKLNVPSRLAARLSATIIASSCGASLVLRVV